MISFFMGVRHRTPVPLGRHCDPVAAASFSFHADRFLRKLSGSISLSIRDKQETRFALMVPGRSTFFFPW